MPGDDRNCFEPDQPSGWTERDFTEFVTGRTWQFARTMPSNPHEYTLRNKDSDVDFEAAVRYIREHGCVEYYAARPYKTLYRGDHKFWTMGALLKETVVINRKPRLADTPQELAPAESDDQSGDANGVPQAESRGTRNELTASTETLHLEIVWNGPFGRETVISLFKEEGLPPDYDGEDYGLYQIYGMHILCGPDTLLYIGRSTGQTFSRRFRNHDHWLSLEEDVAIYLGRIYDPHRHTARDLWNSWVADVRLAECALIYKYSPNYNAISISDPPSLDSFRSVEIVHRGQRHKLHARDIIPADWQ